MPDALPTAESSPSPVGAAAWHFDCAVSQSTEDTAWIRANGELDIATSPQLKRTLHHAIDGARLVVVDLRALTFIDCAGIHALVDVDSHVRRGGRRLILVRGPAHVHRIFELLGVSDRLEIVDLTHLDSAAPSFPSCPAPDAA